MSGHVHYLFNLPPEKFFSHPNPCQRGSKLMGYIGHKLLAAHDHTFELIRHIVEGLGQIADLIFTLDGDPVGEVSFCNENGRLAELLDASRDKPGNRDDGQGDDDADYEQSQGEKTLGWRKDRSLE
jgi:hypothetical protein